MNAVLTVLTAEPAPWLVLVGLAVVAAAYVVCGLLVLAGRRSRVTARDLSKPAPRVVWAAAWSDRKEVTS